MTTAGTSLQRGAEQKPRAGALSYEKPNQKNYLLQRGTELAAADVTEGGSVAVKALPRQTS